MKIIAFIIIVAAFAAIANCDIKGSLKSLDSDCPDGFLMALPSGFVGIVIAITFSLIEPQPFWTTFGLVAAIDATAFYGIAALFTKWKMEKVIYGYVLLTLISNFCCVMGYFSRGSQRQPLRTWLIAFAMWLCFNVSTISYVILEISFEKNKCKSDYKSLFDAVFCWVPIVVTIMIVIYNWTIVVASRNVRYLTVDQLVNGIRIDEAEDFINQGVKLVFVRSDRETALAELRKLQKLMNGRRGSRAINQ